MIYLQKLSIELQQSTRIQCIRNDFFRESDVYRDWYDTFVIASCDFSRQMDKAPPITGRIDLRQTLNTSIPKRYKPTFTTFNIRCEYALVIQVAVWCGQKSLKAEYKQDRFTLLAAEYVPRGVKAGPIRDAGPTYPIYWNHDEAVPAYEAGSSTVQPPTYQDAKNS